MEEEEEEEIQDASKNDLEEEESPSALTALDRDHIVHLLGSLDYRSSHSKGWRRRRKVHRLLWDSAIRSFLSRCLLALK